MPSRLPPMALVPALLVLITGFIVHAPGRSDAQGAKRPAAAPASKSAPMTGQGETGLPEPVVRMREAILEAVRAGRLDDLKTAIELNELKPEISDGTNGDQIAALRALSADGQGSDVLAAIGGILEAPWIAVPLGRDPENNRIFVWPRLAEMALDTLSADDAAALAAIVGADAAEAMRKAGRYSHWRLGIGADGTWHYLRR